MDDEELEEYEDFDEEEYENQPSFDENNVPTALSNRSLGRRNSELRNKPKTPRMPNRAMPKKSDKPNPLAGKKRKNDFLGVFKRKNGDNKDQDKDKKEDSFNSNSDHEEENDENGTSIKETIAKTKRIILLIKVGLIVLVIGFIVLMICAVVYYFASLFGMSDSFSNAGNTSGLDPNSPYYKEALKYHENLNKATEMYADSCGVYLDRTYIHATLTYITVVSQDEGFDEKKMYKKMADNVDDVAKLMVTNCVVDYEKNGTFYNKLRDSNFLKNYYKEQLKFMSKETLVKEIFEYAEAGAMLAGLNAGFISNNLKVTMGTCEQPYNKKLLNDGTNYSSTVGFADYVMGVVMGEVEGSIKRENREFLKAFTIVAASYALGRSGYQSGDTEIWVHNGNCWQLSCDINNGCTYCYDLGDYGTTFTGKHSCNDVGYTKDPMNPNQKQILTEVFQEVFGTVMLNLDGKIKTPSYRDKSSTCGNRECLGQEDAIRDAQNGMTYKQILEKYYDNYTLSNMQEDSYVGNVKYDDGGYSGSVVYYDQTDYGDKFCGQRGTIKTDGCGTTSMAIVLSSFVNGSYTPPVVMKEAYSAKYCGGKIVGTSTSFFKYSASLHNLGYQSEKKTGDLQSVLDALKSGKSLVIAHMGKGKFTRSGHYIVLSKVNDKGEVYVLDPNNNYGTGWHDFNSVIVKELKGSFHIITKR